jgi:O-antigen/teichoic acid export membrane protein
VTVPGELGRERFRLARLAVVAGAGERVVATVVGAGRVALLAWALPSRDYGLYLAVLGIVATTGLIDFGLQYGLMNAVAEARGRDDSARLRSVVSTAFVIYLGIAVVALAAFLPLAFAAPFPSLLRVDADQVGVAHVIAAIGFGEALLVMPLRVFPVAFAGMQQQHVGSAYRTIAGIVQTAAMAAALVVGRKLVPVVAASAAADLGVALLFAGWARKHGVPVELRAAKREDARRLYASGLIFFVLNIANLLKRSFPSLVLANALGPQAVPSFSVPFALFTLGLGLSELIAGSLWPGYGDAVARGDWAWIVRAFRVGSEATLLVSGGVAALGACAGGDVMRLWAPKIVEPPPIVFALLAVWVLTQASATAAGNLVCGLNRIWLYMWFLIGEGVVTLTAGAYLVRAIGTTGIVAAMAIGGGIGAVVLNTYVLPRATSGQVRAETTAHARLIACVVPAAAIGFGVRVAVKSWSLLPHLTVVAGAVAVTYLFLVWTVGLSAVSRGRLAERLRIALERSERPKASPR